MASIINKRQQARHERALHDLIRSVPGNDQCADCQARNPGWASWNLGAFLCMRCGSLHRKMGTHISKVKSLSMDSWTSDQVENMKKRGNTIVNKEYNPRNVKPDIPVDIDEVDLAMERFIRQKYEFRVLEDGKPKPPSRDDSGYHTQKSLDESSPSPPPPPIPPKSGRKFGFGLRSVSSTSRLPRHSDKPSSPRSATLNTLSPSLSLNKQSRVFGANIADVDNLETKLDQLKDMGFPNHKRNASVLKGVGGDLNRAVESLVRLGEGGNFLQVAAAPRKPSTATSLPTPKAEADDPWSITSTVTSSAGAHTTTPQPAKPYNPFDVPNTQNPSATGLESAFQNMQVAQPLSPHTTGGYASASHQMTGSNMALTPLYTSHSYTSSPQPLGYNPFFQTASPINQNAANPYFGSQTAQSTPIQPTRSFSPANPFTNSLSAQSTGGAQQNLAQSQRFAMPVFSSSQSSSSPQTAAATFYQQPQTNPQPSSNNPFDTAYNNNININNFHTYAPNFQQPQYTQQQNPYAQFQQQQQQQPARADKNSILALYNLAPAAAPTMSTIPEQSQVPQMQQQQTMQSQTPYNGMATIPQSNAPTGAVSVSNPFMNNTTQQQHNNNPYAMMASHSSAPAAAQSNGLGIGLGSGPTQASAPPPTTTQANNYMPRAPLHMSKASVDINNLQSGRHSPDAFASLSARFG
ncbi:hypothetical protein UA08_08290 [Talaromyces atroroseus]|uniref:Arf-GAP domain-containing protein n=1 Tax=Talaromyces atroroseus TaxID=1441469 RepID=A0A225AQE7_TALAT|nr:hypothetical protein UA08_08290 [Talaromyces atroroseus]OKL56655.1 hypothetical protein UA08_08290 [Talaromyces atroroseus]